MIQLIKHLEKSINISSVYSPLSKKLKYHSQAEELHFPLISNLNRLSISRLLFLICLEKLVIHNSSKNFLKY